MAVFNKLLKRISGKEWKKIRNEEIRVSREEAMSKIWELYRDKGVKCQVLQDCGKLLAKVYPTMNIEEVDYVLMSLVFYKSPSITILVERG